MLIMVGISPGRLGSFVISTLVLRYGLYWAGRVILHGVLF